MPNKENPSHSIRNGIIATVVGGLILSLLLPSVRLFFTSIFELLKSIFNYLWNLLTSVYEVKGWFLLLLEILGAVVVIQIVAKILASREQGVEDLYVEDNLFGAVWRWSYLSHDVSNLWCFCPKCNIELVYEEVNRRSQLINDPPRTNFICERCKEIRASLEGDQYQALGSVKREIRRKIRNENGNQFVKQRRERILDLISKGHLW